VKKRRDESQDDLDENFNVAEGEETNTDGTDVESSDSENEEEVQELGAEKRPSGDFGDMDDDSTG
jgi:hypothetical protein